MSKSDQDETYSEAETEMRAAAALKRMLNTPHKPHKESKSSASLKRAQPNKHK
jgi:hypothetical protein